MCTKHNILSQSQASYPALLDIATSLSLNKLFGPSSTRVERRYIPAEATVVMNTITLACPMHNLDRPQGGRSTMREWQVATLTAGSTVLTEAEVAAFQAGLRGELLLPEDPTYDAARRIWNANIDKQPALIARCVGVTDVRRAVDFARSHHLLVSVRGGGHSFPGTCVAANGLVIDLPHMHSVRVDPGGANGRAEGGTKWGDFDRETQAFGLGTTGGTNYDTGIGGLTLGGGMGWLGGKHGLACDNLLSVDIVTADGQLRTASATEN